MQDVSIKDRIDSIEIFRMAFNACGIGVDYVQTETILKVVEMVDKKEGKTDLSDCGKLFIEQKTKWEKYFNG